MFENKTTTTDDIKNLLLKKLTSWENKNVKNENEAFNYFYNDSEYLLRMLWQGRLSKINDEEKNLQIWISENYLPKKYGFDIKKIHETHLVNFELSHEYIARFVLEDVWKDYLNSDLENIVKPPKEKVSFLKRIFK